MKPTPGPGLPGLEARRRTFNDGRIALTHGAPHLDPRRSDSERVSSTKRMEWRLRHSQSQRGPRGFPAEPLDRSLCVLAVTLVVLMTIACQNQGDDPSVGSSTTESLASGLREIPWPDTQNAAPRVAKQIEEQRLRVEEAASPPTSAKDRAERLGHAGLLLLTYEFFDGAEACFDNAARLAETDYRWSYLHGYLLTMQGELDRAVSELERSLQLAPDHSAGILRLADARWQLGLVEESRKNYESVLERDDTIAAAHAGLGRIAASASRHDEAVASFERALELEPAANYLHYALAQSYRSLGDPEKAEFHLKLRGDIQVPIDDPLIDPVATLGQSPELYLARAGQAMKNERYDIAADAFRRASELDPEDFGAYRGLSFSLYELGDRVGARKALETALQSATTGEAETDRSRRAEIHRLLGEMHVLDGEDENAVASFRTAVELDERRRDVRELLANALARQGNFAESVEQYDFLIRAQPEDVDLLVRRASARVNLGDKSGALSDFDRALALEPGSAAVRERGAAAYEHFGDHQGAARLREGASKATSGGEDVLLVEARSAIARQEWSKAIAHLEEVLGQGAQSPQPVRAEAHMLMASILGHLGQFDRAISHFGEVLEILPRNEEAWKGQITAFLLAAKYHQARERLRDALEVFPRDSALAHSLARLLVSTPETADRNGALGLELAQRVQSIAPSAEVNQTVAMALAEVGEFARAVELMVASPAAAAPASARVEAFRLEQPWVLRSADEILVVLRGRDS